MDLWCPIVLETEGRHCSSCFYFLMSLKVVMGVIIISIILSSLESIARGQGSVSIPDKYWIGVSRTAPIL